MPERCALLNVGDTGDQGRGIRQGEPAQEHGTGRERQGLWFEFEEVGAQFHFSPHLTPHVTPVSEAISAG